MSQATLAQLLHSKIEGFHASIRKRKRMKMFDNKRLKLQSSLILLENDDDETTALKVPMLLIFCFLSKNRRKSPRFL